MGQSNYNGKHHTDSEAFEKMLDKQENVFLIAAIVLTLLFAALTYYLTKPGIEQIKTEKHELLQHNEANRQGPEKSD